MNCAEANQIDLVDYLYFLGFQPQKVRGEDYWYLSPLRKETNPSFKINRQKNIWYDHGLGKGGTLVDFAMLYFNSGLSETLKNISSFHRQNNFQSAKVAQSIQSDQNVLFNNDNGSEKALEIISAKQPITDLLLCLYLKKRKIAINLANKHCAQVTYQLNNKVYKAIGFKNSAGGYDLRNEYFKGSSAPKYVTYLDNKADTINVFEGFFDFLSHQTIHQNQEQSLTNFLVLNSLAFFERSLLLMKKHKRIHLYLDHDNAGRKCNSLALRRSEKFSDESKLYKGYKDLNEWVMNFGKSIRQKHSLKH